MVLFIISYFATNIICSVKRAIIGVICKMISVRPLDHALLCGLTELANAYIFAFTSTVMCTFVIRYFNDYLFALKLKLIVVHSYKCDVKVIGNTNYMLCSAFDYSIVSEIGMYLNCGRCGLGKLLCQTVSHLFSLLPVTFIYIFIQNNDQ